MNEILSMPKRREILKIILHVTRPESKKEIISPSSTVQMFPGRREFHHHPFARDLLTRPANFNAIIKSELEHRIGTMAPSLQPRSHAI